MIPDLTHDVLLQMGITKAGHRIRILRMQQKRTFDLEDVKTGISSLYLVCIFLLQ
jgi:hypothetical protein